MRKIRKSILMALTIFAVLITYANFSFAAESEPPALNRFEDKVTPIINDSSKIKRNRGADDMTRYDMRDQSYSHVIKVKDQGSTGLCWAYATTTAAEISRAKQLEEAGETVTSFTFSPFHLGFFIFNRVDDPLGKTAYDKNIIDVDYRNLGGNSYITFQALANWIGLTSESKIPDNTFVFNKTLAYDNDYTIKKAEFVSDSSGYALASEVKEAVLEYGSVVTDMYYSSSYLNDSAYKTIRGPESANHIVTIIGWDDTYPKENFKNKPENDGAWIVQNSYGTAWGDEGYMYISYEDKSLSCPMALQVIPASSYDYNYQYDGNSNPEDVKIYSGEKAGNVFTVPQKSGMQKLKSVGFTTHNTGHSDYKVEVYTDVTGTASPVKGKLASSFIVSTDNEGYYTFDLPSDVLLAPGKKYSIVITMMQNTYFGIEDNEDYSWINFKAKHIKGTSFWYDRSSDTWEDLYLSQLSARIKGLTIEEKPIDMSMAKASIAYTNYTYTGNPVNPKVTVTYNGIQLQEGSDYEVMYGENLYPGKGTITISGKGDFSGHIIKEFEIARVAKLNVKSYGTNSITLKWNAKKNVDGYHIYMYKDGEYQLIKTVNGASVTSATVRNLNAGSGCSFRICSFVNDCEATMSSTLNVPVKPAKGALRKLCTGSSHYVTATWYKRNGTGYQLKRATNSKFTKNVKTFKITKSSTLCRKMTGLKKGRTYYVKVRAYKTYGGKTVYGPWSRYKKIKCK